MSEPVSSAPATRSPLAVLSSLALALLITRIARGAYGPSPTLGAAAARQPGSGRAPAVAPAAIHRETEPAPGWWALLRRVYDEVARDRIVSVAAGVTFYVLLAIFPAIAAFVSLYGLFSDPASLEGHLAALGGFLPSGALDIIGEQVRRIAAKGDKALGFASLTGLAISLWSANAGMKAVFDALNIAYEADEKRNFVWLNLWSLAFTAGAILVMAAGLSAIVVIPVVLGFVGLGPVTEWIVWAGRWPLLLAITAAAFALLYRFGPSHDRPPTRWFGPGVAFSAVGWLAASMLFSWYVASFGTYNETYGSLGAVIGFMTWMWISAIIVLVGAELNAETEPKVAVPLRTPRR